MKGRLMRVLTALGSSGRFGTRWRGFSEGLLTDSFGPSTQVRLT